MEKGGHMSLLLLPNMHVHSTLHQHTSKLLEYVTGSFKPGTFQVFEVSNLGLHSSATPLLCVPVTFLLTLIPAPKATEFFFSICALLELHPASFWF